MSSQERSAEAGEEEAGTDFFASSPPAPAPATAPAAPTAPTALSSSVASPPNTAMQTRSKSRGPSLSPTISRNGRSSLFIGGSSDSEDEPIPAAVDDENNDPSYGPSSSRSGNGRPKISPPLKNGRGSRSNKRARSTGPIEIDDSTDCEATLPNAPPRPQWDRRYVGNFCIAGWALSKGKGYVNQGDKITIQRQKPKVTAAAQQASKPPPKKQAKLAFGGKAASSKGGASSGSNGKSKQQEDYVVRFSNMRGE